MAPSSPCFAAGSNHKRALEMVVYDPAAAAAASNKRARHDHDGAEASTSSSSSSSSADNAGALVLHAAPPPGGDLEEPIVDAVPLSVLRPRLRMLPPLPRAAASGEEPPCLRRHFLAALGLRADLPVHFIDDKYVTGTDLDAHQNRFRLPSDGVTRRLRALLTPAELHEANLLHEPAPKPKRPKKKQPAEAAEPHNAATAAAAGEGKKIKEPKKRGKEHGGLRVKLVDLAAGAKQLLLARWDSSHGTVVKGGGYLDFVRRCSFGEGDAVEIWAFMQRPFRLFGQEVCKESLLHVLVVKKHQPRSQCRYCMPLAPALEVNPLMGKL